MFELSICRKELILQSSKSAQIRDQFPVVTTSERKLRICVGCG
jgi:hypothetical protein